MSNGNTIVSLPLDLLLAVMEHLRPLDLIALRMTCRALYDASHQRIVWIDALNRMCTANRLFFPIFRFDKMTIEELCRASVAPSRWLALVRQRCRQNATAEQPLGMTMLRPRFVMSEPCIKLGSDFLNGFLCPGGRFLVLLMLHSLQVWDTERVGKGEGSPQVVEVQEKEYRFVDFVAQATKDGKGLHLVVSCSSFHMHAQRILVYEIFPLDDIPILDEIARIILNSPCGVNLLCSSGNLAAFTAGWQSIWVWDFVNDLWAEWDNTGKNFPRDIILTSNDSILLLGVGETLEWKIPDFKPLGQESCPASPEDVSSSPSLLGSGETPSLAHKGRAFDWYWDEQEHLLDVFRGVEYIDGKTYTWRRYNLARSESILSLPSPVSSSTSALPGPPMLFEKPLDSSLDAAFIDLRYRYCEGDLVGCSLSKSKMRGLMFISGQKPENSVQLKIQLGNPLHRVGWFSACPLSGRVCYAADQKLYFANLFDGDFLEDTEHF